MLAQLKKAHIIIPWVLGTIVATYAVFTGGILPPSVSSLGPADAWHKVESLEVLYNSEDQLTVCIHNEIKQPFAAQWRTTLRKITTAGETYINGAEAEREYDYSPRPPELFCETWTKYTNMPLPSSPGQYVLYVVWPMVDGRGAERTQRAKSFIFTTH